MGLCSVVQFASNFRSTVKMAYFGKEFAFDKEENYEAFISSFGLSEERANGLRNYKPNQKLEKVGDGYRLTLGDKEINFQSGVTFDETVGEGSTSKTTFTLQGDTLTQVQDLAKLKITYVREYSADKLKVTVTSTIWNGTAYRYYNAV